MHLAQILKAHFLVHVAQDFQGMESVAYLPLFRCHLRPEQALLALITKSTSLIAHLTQVTINLHVTTVQDYGPTTNQARVPTIILGTERRSLYTS